MTLTEFLLARIAEDEAQAPESGWTDHEGRCNYCGGPGNARVLAEVEAKRRIVEDHDEDPTPSASSNSALRHLAAVYADHPAYRPDWQASR